MARKITLMRILLTLMCLVLLSECNSYYYDDNSNLGGRNSDHRSSRTNVGSEEQDLDGILPRGAVQLSGDDMQPPENPKQTSNSESIKLFDARKKIVDDDVKDLHNIAAILSRRSNHKSRLET